MSVPLRLPGSNFNVSLYSSRKSRLILSNVYISFVLQYSSKSLMTFVILGADVGATRFSILRIIHMNGLSSFFHIFMSFFKYRFKIASRRFISLELLQR